MPATAYYCLHACLLLPAIACLHALLPATARYCMHAHACSLLLTNAGPAVILLLACYCLLLPGSAFVSGICVCFQLPAAAS